MADNRICFSKKHRFKANLIITGSLFCFCFFPWAGITGNCYFECVTHLSLLFSVLLLQPVVSCCKDKDNTLNQFKLLQNQLEHLQDEWVSPSWSYWCYVHQRARFKDSLMSTSVGQQGSTFCLVIHASQFKI